MHETDTRNAQTTNGVGLTLSSQEPVSAITTVTIDETVTHIWSELFKRKAIQDTFIRSIRNGVSGLSYGELLEWFDENDLTDTHWHGSYRSLITEIARGDKDVWWTLLTQTRTLGQGHYSVQDLLNVAGLFRYNDELDTLAFRLEYDSFSSLRRGQREAICKLLTSLSRGFDIHLVAKGSVRSYLRKNHRSDLPGVSEWNITPRDYSGPSEAFDRLSPNDRETEILRTLESEPTGTLSYHELQSDCYVSDSRIRQCVSTLSDLGLVETFDSPKKVQLLEAGREYLSQVPRQSTFDDSSFSTPKQHPQTRVNPASGKGGKDGQVYRTTFQGRPNKEAAAVAGQETDVCIVKEPVELDQTEKERKTKPISYDEERDEAIVSVRATGALDYLVSSATALASPKLMDNALPVERLEEIDEPEMILRNARNIGGISAKAENNSQILRENLIEWGENIEDLSTEFRHATGDEKKALGSQLMKQSHGLAGSIVHLLDAAGVDLVREIRLASGLELDRLKKIGESLGRSILIQSKYGVFAPYRHLIETESGEPSISPEIDAANPTGTLIGSFVIRGKDAHRIRDSLETQLSSFEFLDEPAEFTIPLTIDEVGRSTFATTITRMLKSKNLRPTRDAVSIVHALTGSPYDAAYALNQLETESDERDVRPDEIRYALSHLEAERILPGLAPTVGKVVQTLIEATEPLTQTELAKRSDVSTQSIRNNRDVLEALDLVTVDGTTWRLSLSFRTTVERRDPVQPSTVGSAFIDAVDSLLEVTLPPERYADPNDEVGQVLFYPQTPWVLVDHPDLRAWVELAAALTGTEQPETETSLSVGPTITQTPIQESENTAVAD